MLFYILILLWIPHSLQISSAYRENGFNETSMERSFMRTQSLIEQRTHAGRMVLLVCRRRQLCQRARSSVPQWIRDINEENKYDGLEFIHYHFYAMGQKLKMIDSSLINNSPMIAYIIGETPYYYTGEISQKSFKSWLNNMDQLNVIRPSSYDEMNGLLSSADDVNCSTKYLVLINDRKKCPYEEWSVIARYTSKEDNIVPVELDSPIAPGLSVLLNRRLRLLPKDQCLLLFLVFANSYSVHINAATPKEVSETIEALIPKIDDQLGCGILDDTLWHTMKDPLSELELIYYSREYGLLISENYTDYIMIGVSGGVAVLILGWSIFWGLNGAFAK